MASPRPTDAFGYAGRRAALVTRHGKERAVARPFRAAVGLLVEPTPEIDTDRLGTFAGDVERPGPAAEVVLAKARLGLARAPIALASEGSFGPHPQVPFLARAVEHLAFLDAGRGLEIVETWSGFETNFAQATFAAGEDPSDFLARIGFPRHAVLVRAAEWRAGEPYDKGIANLAALREAIARRAAASPSGRVRLDADMRAHVNPTRLATIRRLAFRLARRLATACPACRSPGFGRVETLAGLPCAWCGAPTPAPRADVFACPACGLRETRPRPGPACAEPGSCPSCNP